MLRLIVGLGNPGEQYAKTRHNAGAWFCEAIALQYQATWQVKNTLHAAVANVMAPGMPTWYLAIPTVYMNQSGLALAQLMRFFKLAPENILVAHDELDLPPGDIRFKRGGGHGGHNGLRDIIQHIGQDFYRLRIGIGHPGHKDKVVGFVLSAPNATEYVEIEHALAKAKTVMPQLMVGDFNAAMNALHRKTNS